MNFIITLINNIYIKKIFALVLFIFAVYLLKDFFLIILLTFLFSYLFLNLGDYIHTFFKNKMIDLKKDSFFNKLLFYLTSFNSIITILYLIFLGGLLFWFYYGIPVIIEELTSFFKSLPTAINQLQLEIIKVESLLGYDIGLKDSLTHLLDKNSLQEYILPALENAKNIGWFILKLILSLIFSFIFIIDRIKLKKYLFKINNSAFDFFYKEYAYILNLIKNAFWMIFKAQALIALTNAFLTAFWLFVLSVFFWKLFPFIITLTIIVFVCGLIPVLGTFLSSIPIFIVAYSYAGIPAILAILLIITLIHTIEAYYLNPKIVSKYIETPLFLTLMLLLIWEHLFWVIWFLITIPIYYIIIEFIKDFSKLRNP